MIVNLRPENLGLLDCVVEECDERFTSEQQDEIVGIVGDVLGREGDGGENGGDVGRGGVSGENEDGNGDGTDGVNGGGDGEEVMEVDGHT